MHTAAFARPRLCAVLFALTTGCATPLERARGDDLTRAKLEAYAEHLQQHPDDLAARYERAVRILKAEFASEAATAQSDLEAWIATHPDDADAHGWLAEAFRQLGNPDRRAAVLVRHAELEPAGWKPDWVTAFRHLAARRWQAAQATLANALAAADPESRAAAEARFWRGFAALRAGDAKAAAADLAAWQDSRARDIYHRALVLEARCAAGDRDAYHTAARLSDQEPKGPYRVPVARFQYQANHLELARHQLDLHLEQHPRDGRALRLRAACWFATGGTDSRGLEDLAQALAIDPNDVDARKERVAARVKLEAWNSALEDQTAVVEAQPADPDAWLQLARIHLSRNRLDEAIDAVAKACDVGADVPEVHSLRATAFERQGDFVAALASHRRYLEQVPGDAEARLLAARCALRIDRFDAVRAECDRVLADHPGRADARALRALGLAAEGDASAALAELDQLVQRPDPGLLPFLQQRLREAKNVALQPVRTWITPYETALPRLQRADALHRERCHGEALAEVDALLAAAPRVVQGHLLRGMILHDLQRHDDALAAVERYGAVFPDCPLYHRDRAICLAGLGRLDDAALAFERSMQANDQDPHMLHAYAICLTRKGDVEGAWWILGRALKIAPAEEAILLSRIETSEALGKHEAAATAWSGLAAVRRGDAAVNRSAGQAWQRAGDHDLAMRHYRAALAGTFASPQDRAAYWWNRAVCQIQLKQFREAQDDFERALQHDATLPRLDFTDYDRLRREQEAAWREHLAELARGEAEARRRAQQNAAAAAPLPPPTYYRIWDESSWDNLDYAGYLQRRIRAQLDGKDPNLVPRHEPRR